MAERKPPAKGKGASGDSARAQSGGGLAGILSGPLGQRLAIGVGVLSALVMVVSLSVAFWPAPPKPAPVERPLTLTDALKAIDEGDYAEARQTAMQLRQQARWQLVAKTSVQKQALGILHLI